MGITKNGCECLEIDGSESKSGLYLDDTTAGRIPLTEAIFDCSDPDAEDFLNRIIEDASREAYRELTKVTGARLANQYISFSDNIGRKKDWTKYYNSNAGYHYMSISPKKINGAYMVINNITLHTDGADTAFGISDENNTVIKEIADPVNYPYTLKLDKDYFVFFQSANKPKQLKLHCCGNNEKWQQYLKVGEGISANISDMEFSKSSNSSRGIVISANFECRGFDFLCSLDYQNSYFGIVFSKLIQQIARKNLAFWLLSTNKPTAYTILSEDELRNVAKYLIDDIQINLNFLPEIYNHSDCYKCNGMYIGEINV